MSLIELKNIIKTYTHEDVEVHALNDVSFKINNGEFVAIMGPSGSGKSTLLQILGFLDKPTSGKYFFEEKNTEDYSQDDLARARNEKMGFIFQAFNLLPRTTVLDNVKLPLLYSKIKEGLWDEMAKEAIESVGLSHRMRHEPSRLSGGEQQRVAIARALVTNPQVIFADEPTGNLDSKSGHMIMKVLQKLNEDEKRTIILITHESHTAEHAQRIIKVFDGKIESDTLIEKRREAKDFIK
ncbi:macrolide ABC transporter ATP-binding protein [Candidatus Wolfebacteria bacterium CG10_big_fil_rev_8_21_14_0_10_31_9]|uniref:Macrolide ABC transporter ATP-binding protein n=1 Tax=Candidatus Wolfebacteria bacterium CG10_big_fil_rev_8_21_14_0_10_31_9 TaxID=1975070 RepID=A0A2H0RC08_9BACT|nr:MAG: macrolide ABC transporter ATP-binding protein [Candidatus Wolfebacteria bacterium CG10_big_fil_rev_8_21_14_0_10_31_9]